MMKQVVDKTKLDKGVVERNVPFGDKRAQRARSDATVHAERQSHPTAASAAPPPPELALTERSPWDDEPGFSVPLISVVAAVLVALIVGLGVGLFMSPGGAPPGGNEAAGDGASGEREVLYYRNPMNPAITSPVPAKDEMGMDYIPVYADGGGGAASAGPAGTVQIDPVTVQNIGVRTAVVKRQPLGRHVRAVGRVDFDEENLARLHPKIAGWVETLHVKKTGEPVRRGEALMSIYSPELVASQHEFLLALTNREALKESRFTDIRQGAEDLLDSARRRLLLLDVAESQLQALEQTRQVRKTLQVHSPFDGVVINMGVREGQYVTPGTELYRLADLRRVWVYVDVYEHELPWIRVGDPATMSVAAAPGKVYEGNVASIYPFMDSKTRTVQVRLEFDNADSVLKPDMFASVVLDAGLQVDAVVVPSEAVLRSGDREQVFVVRGEGKFEPREVRLGLSAEGVTQVLDGLESGERVVTSSQFLIDSESKLREATAKMMESMSSDMDMGDLDMSDLDMSDMTM